MSSPTTDSDWKKLVLDAKKHYERMATCLWRLTKTLVALYDDEEFRIEAQGLKQEPHEWIDAEFPHLPFRFLELKAILDAHPSEHEWKDNKLSALADAIPVAERTASERKSPTRITKKEHEEVVADRDHQKYRADFLEKRVGELEQQLAEAKETISRLEGRLEQAQKLQNVA